MHTSNQMFKEEILEQANLIFWRTVGSKQKENVRLEDHEPIDTGSL